jgi:hypothetical protein
MVMYDGDERHGTHTKAQPRKPRKDEPVDRKTRNWITVILAALFVVTLCVVGAALVGNATVQHPTATTSDWPTNFYPSQVTVGAKPPTVPAPTPVTVKGKGNAVGPVSVTLIGAFNVEYSFGSWCGIVHFLKADGSEGSGTFESINDCSDNFETKLTGSTVVHLKDVTMVKVSNTQGNWILKFTPLG